jgi:hypothetical protein
MSKSMQFKKSVHGERGQAIVLIVLMLTALLGITALAVDGGRLYSGRRSAQNSADNAALAGALALCNSGDPLVASFASADNNGYDNDGTSNIVEVNHPPMSGLNIGDNEYVEVIITSNQEASFAQVLSQENLQVASRAVARCFSTYGPVAGGYAMLALNPTADCAFNVVGSGSAAAVQGGIYINSSHSTAFCASGGGTGPGGVPRVDAERIDIVGGYDIPAWVTVVPNPPAAGSPVLVDPLALLQPPTKPPAAPHPWTCSGFPTSLTNGKANPYVNGHLDQTNHWWTETITVCPGTYQSFNVSSDANVVMMPGIYYIEGAIPSSSSYGFQVDGDASLVGDGVMIYMATSGVHISASGRVSLTPLTTQPWAGMIFFMGRTNTSNYLIDGDGDIVIRGTVYAPAGHVRVSGSGTSTAFNGQFIASDYYIDGAGIIRIDYDPDFVFGGNSGSAYIDLAE